MYRPSVGGQQSRRNRSSAILERVKSLEEKNAAEGLSPTGPSSSLENLKSISQRRSELKQAFLSKPEDESETSSLHSTSTVSTVVESSSFLSSRPSSTAAAPAAPLAHPLPKGWVKHIIGKLQGEAK